MKFWVSALKELWCQPLVTFGEKRKDSCYYVGQELKKKKKTRQLSILRQPLQFFPWERASVGHLGLNSLRSAQLLTLLFDVICHVLGSLIAVLAGRPASPKLPLEIWQLFPLADSPSTAQAACVWLKMRNQVFDVVVISQVSRFLDFSII